MIAEQVHMRGRPIPMDDVRDSFLDEAAAIADQLIRRQVCTKGGNPTWLGPTGYGTKLNPVQIVQLGPHLYDGKLGIAFFLAALGSLTARSEYADLSLRILAPLRRSIADLVRDPAAAESCSLPIGGLIGTGSLIYGLLRIGKWLEDPSLLVEAHQATALISSKRIAADDRVYFQAGSTGTLLALLALHEVSPEPNQEGRSPLDIARECGRRLLQSQVSFAGRPKAWPLSPGKPPLIGFSYGAAGSSYALLRLSEISPEPEWKRAAVDGWDYIQSFYRPEERRWTDIRALLQSRLDGPEEGTWRDWWLSGNQVSIGPQESVIAEDKWLKETLLGNKWCHGAPGIAMARIGALATLDSPSIREEIAGALDETQSFSEDAIFSAHPADDLCCGHMGRIEALLYASQKFADRHGLQQAALALAQQVLRRARDRGTYTLSGARGTDCFSPSLFLGYAGIGYTFLRLARPGDLPCPLLLE